MLQGPLAWLGIVESVLPLARTSADLVETEIFRVTALGQKVLAEDWNGVANALGATLSNSSARMTVQPNLEVLAPPDLDPTTYLNLARLGELRSVDIYTTFAITWDSLMNALDRGSSAKQVLAFLESTSATAVDKKQYTTGEVLRTFSGHAGRVRPGGGLLPLAVAAAVVWLLPDRWGRPVMVLAPLLALWQLAALDVDTRVAASYLDFDLEASHEVNLGTTPVTVTAEPFVVAMTEPLDTREFRVRGPLGSVDESGGSYVVDIRPFYDPNARHGEFTVETDDDLACDRRSFGREQHREQHDALQPGPSV